MISGESSTAGAPASGVGAGSITVGCSGSAASLVSKEVVAVSWFCVVKESVSGRVLSETSTTLVLSIQIFFALSKLFQRRFY